MEGYHERYFKRNTNKQKSINVPFGYSISENGSIITLEDKAMLVREIYRLFLLYKPYHKVSEQINNSENFPNHPYKFTPIEVKSILHNIFYAGHLQTVSISDNTDIVLPFHHDDIVPNEIWDKVQKFK